MKAFKDTIPARIFLHLGAYQLAVYTTGLLHISLWITCFASFGLLYFFAMNTFVTKDAQ